MQDMPDNVWRGWW